MDSGLIAIATTIVQRAGKAFILMRCVMLSNPQKSLLKRAQRQARLSDEEYREVLHLVTGFRSSTAPDFSNRDLDKVLAFVDAIYWRGIDAGLLQRDCSANAPFRERGFWISRNTALETSRDRFNERNVEREIADLEGQIRALGFNQAYCAAIAEKVTGGRTDAHARHLYLAALSRTLRAKRKLQPA